MEADANPGQAMTTGSARQPFWTRGGEPAGACASVRCLGALVVEFALVLTLLFVLVLGAVEATAAWRIRNVLMMGAREGARIASSTPNLQLDDAEVLQFVEAILIGSGVDPSAATGSVQFEEPLTIGDPVTVSLTYRFEPFVLGLVPGFEDEIPLASGSTVRYWTGTGAIPAP